MRADQNSSINLSDPPRSRTTGHKSRHVALLSNVPLLGRTALASQIQQVASEAVPPHAEYPNLIAFLQFWKWFVPYVRDCIHRKAPYETYSVDRTGIFPVSLPQEEKSLRIAIAADWATGTLEAETVAENMKASNPHCTVHLGDVYYMGEASEINENCLGQPTAKYRGVEWPPGSLGSFALMGNHEMYSGGQGYYGRFLKTLGLLKPDKSVKDPQSAGYFCLDTGHWQMLGLDTGYHSGGMPALAAVPLVNRIPFLNVDARFDDKMMAWLGRTMRVLQSNGTKKPVILLTHHQPVSSFEHAFIKPAKQLARAGLFDGQELVWLYGHEHRLTVYKKRVIAGSLNVYPRCIGHGGMPTRVTVVDRPKPEILYYDPRQHPIDKNDPDTMVGYNGHAVLVFHGKNLTIEYHDVVDNHVLLTETFTPDASGSIQYSSSKAADSPISGSE